MSSLCWVFASANHGVHAAKSWRIKSGTPKISLGINVDIRQFFNTAACFYFLVVLAPPVSDMTLRGDLGHHLGWPNMPVCFSTYRKPNSWKREQLQAMSTPGFGSGSQRVTVMVMLSKVTCRFSSKGFDALSTINSWEMLLSNVPHQEVNGAFIALCPPLLSVLGNPRCWPKYSYFCILP